MSTLAGGAFITSIDGKRCTAVPKAGASSTANANTETKETTTATTSATASVAQFTAAVVTAASSQDEGSTSTTISTSLSLTTSTSITSDPPPQTLQVQASVQVAPLALDVTPAPEPPPATTSTVPTSTQIDTSSQSESPSPSQSQPQPAQTELPSVIIQTSQTDTVDTAPATQTAADADTAADIATATLQQGTALPDITTSPTLLDSATPLFTTIGTAPAGTNSASADATGSSSSTNGAVSAVPIASNNNAIQSTVAVAGGVIGGVLAISIVAFFAWWWRRRTMNRRRSTLLTPLTIDNTFGPDEKGAYVINRGSIGPTPRAERFKATLGYNMRKINGSISRIVTRASSRGSTATTINMNRGNSQFVDPAAAAATTTRPGSSSAARADNRGRDVTTKDRLMDWYARLTADIGSTWRLRKRQNPNSDDLFGSPRGMNEKRAGGDPAGATPDFLTLLGMDDRALDREAQRRRMSPSRTRDGGSASSSDRFLGGLNLSFGGGDDPFSDDNAANAHISAKPAPLVVSATGNPFSDANAIPAVPKAGGYVADMRRSRGQSAGQHQRPPSSVVGGYRESGASVGSFGTRRNKFRSDPFDLERPELLGSLTGGSMSSSAGATVGSGDLRRPAGAHTRGDSFTSKYSSGVPSMADWSDPGPDVGPAAGRGGWEGRAERESPTQGWRSRMEKQGAERRVSGGSQGSVGKAM